MTRAWPSECGGKELRGAAEQLEGLLAQREFVSVEETDHWVEICLIIST